MKAVRTSRRTGPRERRWRTTPPLTRGLERLDGLEVVREVRGELGIPLWQAYRNVMFWAGVPPRERAGLFASGAGDRRLAQLAALELPAALREPLTSVAELLGDAAGAEPAAVAEACAAVARWAADAAYGATALAFTQAAALARPDDASRAHEVARLAEARHEQARAETWYRYAIMLARRAGDWESYARAYTALGDMYRARGSAAVAQRMYLKAARSAQRKHLPSAAPALHALFLLAGEAGRGEQAHTYARAAARAYRAGDGEGLSRLALDVATFWVERGRFARALPLLRALIPYATRPAARAAVLATLARAAGGETERDTFREVYPEARRLAREAAPGSTGARHLLVLARGAAELGERDRAERLISEALERAQDDRDARLASEAEAMLAPLRAGKPLPKVKPASERVDATREADAFAAELTRVLERGIEAEARDDPHEPTAV